MEQRPRRLSTECVGMAFVLLTLTVCLGPAGGPARAQGNVTASPHASVDANFSPIPDVPTDSDLPPAPAKTLLAALQDGGPMLLPLAACSFLLFVFIFERAISLRRGRVIPRPFVKRFLQQLRDGQLDRKEALARCQDNRSPVAEVFSAGVMKWERPAVEVEQAIIDAGERVASRLRRYLRLFNGISTISPLLGLLGTVVGMIRAFSAIATADAMGKPELLAGGISQALLTTAAGLTVAIPAIVAYLFFSSRVDQLVMSIDTLGQQVVNAVASDTWKDMSPRKSKPQRQKAA